MPSIFDAGDKAYKTIRGLVSFVGVGVGFGVGVKAGLGVGVEVGDGIVLITMFLFPPSEFALPEFGNVSIALFSTESFMLPPARDKTCTFV